MNNNKKYKYLGAIHIHSLYSDGTGNICDIAKAAKRSGLDWIIMTDHNSLDVEEGTINGVTIIKGEEISFGKENHYIALGVNKVINSCAPCDFVQEVREQGGFGFVAHPDERIGRKNSCEPIRWTDETTVPDGIEIWNWFSQWADGYNSKNIFKIACSFLFRHNLVSSPYRETMNRWDKLNCCGKKVFPAIGGLDAHALKISDYFFPVTVFPYKTMFKTISNVIYLDEPLCGDFEKRKKQILTALKRGNNIIINRKTGENIPEIFVENETGHFFCGETAMLTKETFLNINLSKKCDISIFKDGIKYAYICKQSKVRMPLRHRGKYRAEIEIKKKGFAYSNPVVVI